MPSRSSSPIWLTTASSIQPDLSHSAARGASSLWANWRAMSRIIRWSSLSSISCISVSPSGVLGGLAWFKAGEEGGYPCRVDLGQSGRIPVRVLVLVDDQRAHAFPDVAIGKPLAVQVQLEGEAIGQGQRSEEHTSELQSRPHLV